MSVSAPLIITLSDDLAEEVRGRVASGAYGSEQEVIRDGLRALSERDDASERWLATEGVARFDAYVSAPAETLAADAAAARLRAHIAERAARRTE